MGLVRRRFGDFLGNFTQNYMITQRQAAESDLVRQRQLELSHQQMVQKLLEGVLTNPDMAERLKGLGVPSVGGLPMEAYLPTDEQKASKYSPTIAKANNLNEVPTNEDITGAVGAGNKSIQQLMAEAAARRQYLGSVTTPKEVTGAYNPVTKTTEDRFLPGDPRLLTGMTVPTSPTPEQKGQNEGATITAEQPAKTAAEVATVNALAGPKARAGGQLAASEASARMPFEIQLAQTRADTQLLNQQAMDDYRKAHPAATSQELNRRSTAGTALGMIGENRQMLEEMNKRGLIGPLAGRWGDLVTGKIKSENLLQNPADAKLVADYFTSMKLLSSLAAVAHGGARGGGSIQMAQRFDQMVNGVGDASIISGQLNGLERLMKHYHDDPNAAPDDIPELTTPATPLSTGKAKLQQMRGGVQ